MVRKLLEREIAVTTPQTQLKDSKTRLQELLQARSLALPAYEVISLEGSAHDQSFTVKCRVEDLGLETTGTGSSRRKAEQEAAAAMLKRIGELPQ